MNTSPILEALGPASFAEFHAVRYPGKVLWCNFELLRQLGFAVPPTNLLTPKLHEQLQAVLSLRAVNGNNNVHDTVKMFADKYGGEGVTPALGAGRAGFLSQGNLYVKGLGFTPLFRHNDADDFVHSHGGVHLEDCLSEAVFGEVNHNLFELGANRIVAIIDQGKSVYRTFRQRATHRARDSCRRTTSSRTSACQTRAWQSHASSRLFVSITRATAQLVILNGVADVSATMLRVIDDHARTAAGFVSLAHDSRRAQPVKHGHQRRDARPADTINATPHRANFKLDYVQSAFGTEHKERGFHLAEMYRRVLRTHRCANA